MSWKDSLKNFLRPHKSKRPVRKSLGSKTQFEDVTHAAQHQQLVIGLDFGTSFTKVVVGEQRLKFAAPIGLSDNGTSAYLLATEIWRNSNGFCSLNKSNNATRKSNLKIKILENDWTEENLAEICVYLAFVLRRTRAFIFDDKETLYGKRYIDWFINIGVPTDTFHEHKLLDVYRDVVFAAWTLSTREESITLEDALYLLTEPHEQETESSTQIHPEAIAVVPEFVAQVTGYVRSPQRRRGLHLLVDIGGGTLDATVFNVHKHDGEDRFPIFAKAVASLGTRYLVKHRIQGSGLEETGELNPFNNVPSAKKFARLLKMTESDIEVRDKPFRTKVAQTVIAELEITKKEYHPLSLHWESGVPMFLCGGGAKLDFYRNILTATDKLGRFNTQPTQLPMPTDLEAPGLDLIDFDRVSVAYGLSFDKVNIGEILRDDQLDRMPEETKNSSDGIGQCRLCNGTGGLVRPCKKCGGSGNDR